MRFQDNDKKRRRSETEEDSAPSGQHDYYDDDEYDEYEYEYTDGSDEGQDAEQSTSSVAVAQQPEPLPKIMKRPRAGTGSSATSFVGDAGGRAPEYVNQDIGYQGPGALDAVSNLSGLTRSTGMSPRSLEWNALMGRPHPSHIQEELRLILGPYPNLETRMGYCQLFLDRFVSARNVAPYPLTHVAHRCLSPRRTRTELGAPPNRRAACPPSMFHRLPAIPGPRIGHRAPTPPRPCPRNHERRLDGEPAARIERQSTLGAPLLPLSQDVDSLRILGQVRY